MNLKWDSIIQNIFQSIPPAITIVSYNCILFAVWVLSANLVIIHVDVINAKTPAEIMKPAPIPVIARIIFPIILFQFYLSYFATASILHPPFPHLCYAHLLKSGLCLFRIFSFQPQWALDPWLIFSVQNGYKR